MRKKTLVSLGLAKTCGAKTRKGTPCKCLQVFRNGRCKFHGGLSTGPRTAEGIAAVTATLVKWRKAQQRIASASHNDAESMGSSRQVGPQPRHASSHS